MNRTTFTILGLITLALLSWGLHEALVVAPTEQTRTQNGLSQCMQNHGI